MRFRLLMPVVPGAVVSTASIDWPDLVPLAHGPHPDLRDSLASAAQSLHRQTFGVAHLVAVADDAAVYRTRRRWLRRPRFGMDCRRSPQSNRLRLLAVVVT